MPIPRFRKEPPTKTRRAFTGGINETMFCCGQAEMGNLTINSFPKGQTRATLNWIQANYEFKQYQFVTMYDTARVLAGNLKAGGAIGVRLIRWRNPLHGNLLGTVIFHVANPTFDEEDYN